MNLNKQQLITFLQQTVISLQQNPNDLLFLDKQTLLQLQASRNLFQKETKQEVNFVKEATVTKEPTGKQQDNFVGQEKQAPPQEAVMTESSEETSFNSQTTSCAEIAQNAPNLTTLNVRLRGCLRCKLANERQTIVFGTGNPKANLMFIGEGPGEEEDKQGKPFVGKAGRLLTQLIRSISLHRDAVYISNIVKCRPPSNRNPEADEMEACIAIIKKQIELIQPKLIVTLGNIATKSLLGSVPGITKTAGQKYQYNDIFVIPLFHPAFLLRQQSQLQKSWDCMQTIRTHLEAN